MPLRGVGSVCRFFEPSTGRTINTHFLKYIFDLCLVTRALGCDAIRPIYVVDGRMQIIIWADLWSGRLSRTAVFLLGVVFFQLRVRQCERASARRGVLVHKFTCVCHIPNSSKAYSYWVSSHPPKLKNNRWRRTGDTEIRCACANISYPRFVQSL